MRYFPPARYTFDEIVEQCRNAINRPRNVDHNCAEVDYAEVRKFFHYDVNEVLIAR